MKMADDSLPLRKTDEAQTEAALRGRVERAKFEYRRAAEETEKLLQIGREVGPGSPDGAAAIRKAVGIQQHATIEYSAALKAFADFLLHRRCPDDEDGRIHAIRFRTVLYWRRAGVILCTKARQL